MQDDAIEEGKTVERLFHTNNQIINRYFNYFKRLKKDLYNDTVIILFIRWYGKYTQYIYTMIIYNYYLYNDMINIYLIVIIFFLHSYYKK